MKVYVWEDVLWDYNSGMMVAIAQNIKEARAALMHVYPSIPEDDLAKKPKVYNPSTMKKAKGFVIYGSG